MFHCWICAVTVFLNKMQNRTCFFHCPMLLYTQMYLQKLQEEDALYCGNSSLPVPTEINFQITRTMLY